MYEKNSYPPPKPPRKKPLNTTTPPESPKLRPLVGSAKAKKASNFAQKVCVEMILY
jgi:hypothetical protein